MITNPENLSETLRMIVLEAERLASQTRTSQFSHLVVNDVQAVTFMEKLHAKGYDTEVKDAEACLERLRIAVETGVYPRHLLMTRKS